MWLLFWVFLQWLQLLYPWSVLTACLCHQGRHLNRGALCYCSYHLYQGVFGASDGRAVTNSEPLLWSPLKEEGAYLNQPSLDCFFQHNMVLLKIPILLINVVNPGWFQGSVIFRLDPGVGSVSTGHRLEGKNQYFRWMECYSKIEILGGFLRF